MKRKMALILMAVVIMSMPLYAFGQDYSDYFALKFGQYTPTGDLDDIESGSNVEVSFGTYFSENFSFETSVGFLKADETFTYFVSGIGTVSEKDAISATPILFTLKGHIPFKVVELYGGVGIGMYFATIEIDIDTPIGSLYFFDSDDIFGYHFLAGINFNITEQLFLGIEGKIFKTNDLSFSDTDQGITLFGDMDLDGYTISGQIGFRF